MATSSGSGVCTAAFPFSAVDSAGEKVVERAVKNFIGMEDCGDSMTGRVKVGVLEAESCSSEVISESVGELLRMEGGIWPKTR